MHHTRLSRVLLFALSCLSVTAHAEEPAKPDWNYAPELLKPFWKGDTVHGETVLFLKDAETGEAKASVLFPITKVLAVRNSVGDVTYEEGRDYLWKPDSLEIVLPADSRIGSFTTADMRRPDGSQKYKLTHRDGNGEIRFGAELEYAGMQTCITYEHGPIEWKTPLPQFSGKTLPRTIQRLRDKDPVSLVVLGDSISAGANASALYDKPPYQPAYPELVRRHLQETFGGEVTLTNLAVGGTTTPWGLTQLDKVAEAKPDLVVLAFGMNDSSGRSAADYQKNTKAMIEQLREKLPDVEFVLVASMRGNASWTALKQELFPQYRDALKELTGPGIALADVTAIWDGFLERKHDWDQTGNGVNHPNDFGHRVYTQVITSLLIENE